MGLLSETITRTGEFTGRIVGFREVELGTAKKPAIEIELDTHQKFNIFNVRALDNLGTYVEGSSAAEVLAAVRDNKVAIQYEVTDYVNDQGYTFYNISFIPKGGYKKPESNKIPDEEIFNPSDVDLSEIK